MTIWYVKYIKLNHRLLKDKYVYSKNIRSHRDTKNKYLELWLTLWKRKFVAGVEHIKLFESIDNVLFFNLSGSICVSLY